jgi:Fur family ferric uptake transcriptional regulator
MRASWINAMQPRAGALHSGSSPTAHLDLLKHSGLKVPLPRLRILELFHGCRQRHLAAEDIYRHLLAQDSDLGLATIYRVLSQFEQAGILRKVQFGDSKSVYELVDGTPCHGHLISQADGAVYEFYDPLIESRLARIAQEYGMEITDYVLTVFARPL